MDAGQSSGLGVKKKKKNRKNMQQQQAKQGPPSKDRGHAAQLPKRTEAPPVAANGIQKQKPKKHKKKKLQQGLQAAGDARDAAPPPQRQQQREQQQLQQRQQQRQQQPQRQQQLPVPVGGPGSSGKGKGGKGGGSLLDKMRARLQGGRFRWLNEKLYTCEGGEALSIMRQDPQLYTQYHEGFREQTKGWPVQPVEVAIRWLKSKPPGWVVADLGCGDARLAASVPQEKVHSFDLVATAPGVVACNMAKLPLSRSSLDAAVFCLSLMGTDYGSFVEEAARILKPGGWLWVAEVQSRFVDESGQSVIDDFVEGVEALGFELKHKDLKNPYFFTLQLQKRGKGGKGADGGGGGGEQPEWPALRACQYKKR